jgi:hypothetical protein
MRSGFLGSIAAWVAGAGLAWGQSGMAPTGPQRAWTTDLADSQVIQAHVGRQGVMPPPITVSPAMPAPEGGPVYPPPKPWNLNDAQAPNGVGPDDGAAMAQAPRIWTTWEYLGWVLQSQPVRYPFITTSDVASGGVIFAPTTSILFTETDIPYNLSNGFRISGGLYWDAACRSGFELSGFSLEDKRKTFRVDTDAGGSPVLARPFVNFATGLQDALVVTSPAFASGGIQFSTDSQLWGAEGSLYLNLFRSCPACYCGGGAEFFAGLRYLELTERIEIVSQSHLFPGVPDPAAFGTGVGVISGGDRVLTIFDSFRTFNEFYGANFGMRTELRAGCWVLTFTGKVAFGDMHSIVDVGGATTFSRGVPPTVGSVRGGVLATPDSDGRDRQDRFTVVPEGTLNIGYQVTPNLQFFIGYNFIYINNVVRVGDVINPVVNPGVVPASPAFGGTAGVFPGRAHQFEWSDFWAQGFNVGFTVRY